MSKVPSTDTDPWDHLVDDTGGTGVPARQKAPVPTRAVPEDWDDDPLSSDGEESQKIWEDANKAGPMPELVLASSRAGSSPNVVPPASAFQSPVHILKRSSVPPQKHTNASPSAYATGDTFAERSARYNAARERIFADTTEGKVGGGEGGASSLVIRNPRGPAHSPGPNGQGSQGFSERVGSQRGVPSTLERKE